jgi:hypothetical protein
MNLVGNIVDGENGLIRATGYWETGRIDCLGLLASSQDLYDGGTHRSSKAILWWHP